jgi:hypothetical protein
MTITTGRIVSAALLGLALALSISGVYVGLAVFVIFLAAAFFQEGRKWSWTPSPLDVPIAVLFVWGSVFSSFQDQYPLLFFYLFAHAACDADIHVMTRWFLIGSAVAGLWAVVQVFSGVIYNPTPATYTAPLFFEGWPRGVLKLLAVHTNRAVGSRSHALTYAECLMPAVFLFLALIVKRPSWRVIGGLVLTLLGILFARGRAVWIGVFTGFLVFSFFIPLKRRLTVWALLAALLVAIGTFSPTVRGRALSAFSPAAGSLSDQQSKQLRFYIWNEAFRIIKSSPLTGVGSDGVKINFKNVPGYEERVWTETHNIYLQQAAERGVIGLGILLWVFVILLKQLWRAPNVWRPALVSLLAAFLVAGWRRRTSTATRPRLTAARLRRTRSRRRRSARPR